MISESFEEENCDLDIYSFQDGKLQPIILCCTIKYNKEASMLRVKRCIIYGCNDKSLDVILTLCQFSRILVLDSFLEPMICQATGSGPR